jgi:hypothetical protein
MTQLSILTGQCIFRHFIVSPTCLRTARAIVWDTKYAEKYIFHNHTESGTHAEIYDERKMYLMLLYLVYTNIYALSFVCVCVCVCVCIYIYTRVCVCACIYIHIYTYEGVLIIP